MMNTIAREEINLEEKEPKVIREKADEVLQATVEETNGTKGEKIWNSWSVYFGEAKNFTFEF